MKVWPLCEGEGTSHSTITSRSGAASASATATSASPVNRVLCAVSPGCRVLYTLFVGQHWTCPNCPVEEPPRLTGRFETVLSEEE